MAIELVRWHPDTSITALRFSNVMVPADTVMSRPNADLVAEVFPGVEIRGDLGVNDSLFSTAKAGRLLGYRPEHSWRDEV